MFATVVAQVLPKPQAEKWNARVLNHRKPGVTALGRLCRQNLVDREFYRNFVRSLSAI